MQQKEKLLKVSDLNQMHEISNLTHMLAGTIILIMCIVFFETYHVYCVFETYRVYCVF